MKQIAIVVAVALAFVATLSSVPADAQPFSLTFVSGLGSDSNPCTRTQPCLTFAHALVNTNAGGEIVVLDPGDYGPLVINKAISIVNDGVGTVGIRALSNGTAITINAGPSDNVSLRGLTIEGAGVGNTGIVFNSGQSLTIGNCVIRHFMGNGIDFLPNASSRFSVSSTLVAENGSFGIIVLPTGSGVVRAIFNRVEVNNNGIDGILVDGSSSSNQTIKATVSDSVAAHNGGAGLKLNTILGQASPLVMLFHSVVAFNGTGVVSNGPVDVFIAQSAMFGNTTSWTAGPGLGVFTYGDNYVDANDSDATFPNQHPTR
jgi:hypothetical protein